MGKVTVIVADDKSETVETEFVTCSGVAGYTNYQQKLVFQVRDEWPTCLEAQPQKAVADEWEIVATVDDETQSGRIMKVKNATVYFDNRF